MRLPREEQSLEALYPSFNHTVVIPVIYGSPIDTKLFRPIKEDSLNWPRRLDRAKSKLPKPYYRLVPGASSFLTGKARPGRPPKNWEEKLLHRKRGVVDGSTPTRKGTYFIERPARHYIRMDSGETCDGSPEYHMDDQGISVFFYTLARIGIYLDINWLQLVNGQRRALKIRPIKEEAFEFIMEGLEKGWHRLSAPLHILQSSISMFNNTASHHSDKQINGTMTQENSGNDWPCAVCGDPDTSNTNAIVFCDECDVAVHQDCYGVPHIPEGPWLCRRCYLAGDLREFEENFENQRPQCQLCPWPDGPLKRTADGSGWVHVSCARFMPGVHFLNTTYLEPIDLSSVDPQRYLMLCSLCKIPQGAVIQCSCKSCATAYHLLCARRAGLMIDYGKKQTFCKIHGPLGSKINVKSNSGIIDENEEVDVVGGDLYETKGNNNEPPKKKGRTPLVIVDSPSSTSHRLTRHRLPPPVAPAQLVESIVAALGDYEFELGEEASQQDTDETVAMIARYWALKRAKRRNTPLLKRLQLEPWGGVTILSLSDLESKKTRLEELKDGIHAIKNAFQTIEKRERLCWQLKMKELEMYQLCIRPFALELHSALSIISTIDINGYFQFPVNPEEVPDYLEIIRQPMDFSTITRKLSHGEYSEIQEFERDLRLICSNAKLYNRPETEYWVAADELEPIIAGTMEKVKRALSELDIKREGDWYWPCLAAIIHKYNMNDLDMPTAEHYIPDTRRERRTERRQSYVNMNVDLLKDLEKPTEPRYSTIEPMKKMTQQPEIHPKKKLPSKPWKQSTQPLHRRIKESTGDSQTNRACIITSPYSAQHRHNRLAHPKKRRGRSSEGLERQFLMRDEEVKAGTVVWTALADRSISPAIIVDSKGTNMAEKTPILVQLYDRTSTIVTVSKKKVIRFNGHAYSLKKSKAAMRARLEREWAMAAKALESNRENGDEVAPLADAQVEAYEKAYLQLKKIMRRLNREQRESNQVYRNK